MEASANRTVFEIDALAEGLEKGLEKGRMLTLKEVIKRMRKRNMDPTDMVDLTGATLERVNHIISLLQNSSED